MTVTDTPDLSIIVRVEKLLAHGSDPGATPAERELFQAKAAELIARHRINRSLIGGHLAADDKIDVSVVGKFDGVYGRVRIDVANAIAKHFDCEVFWSGYGNNRTLKVYGFRSDREIVVQVANRLLADADLRAQSVQAPQYVDMYNPDNDTYYTSEKGAKMAAQLRERRGFYMGYARAVTDRLRAAQDQAEQTAQAEGVDTHSAALVLVDRKRQVAEQLRTMNLRSAGAVNVAGQSGHAQGYAAGSQVSLAHQNSVGSTKAIGR